jgi:hypothetical protein
MKRVQTMLACQFAVWLCVGVFGDTASENEYYFTQKVKPLLEENCFKCHSHSAEHIKGGLVLDSLGGLLTGGDSGPAIVPGRPAESLLIKAVSYEDKDLQMPPKNKQLKPEEISVLGRWIAMGAPWLAWR